MSDIARFNEMGVHHGADFTMPGAEAHYPPDLQLEPMHLDIALRVDVEKCTGHARCWSVAPEVYELDDLGYNVTPVKDVPAGLEELARKGALACPEQAITVEE